MSGREPMSTVSGREPMNTASGRERMDTVSGRERMDTASGRERSGTASRREERGMATLFVVGMSLLLLVCAGLVVDGGLAINARMRVADDAEQAARVGADSIDVQVLRAGGDIQVNQQLAQTRAADYLRGRGYASNQFLVDVQQDGTVDVTVEDTTSTLLLGLVNVHEYNVGAGAVAAPETDETGGP